MHRFEMLSLDKRIKYVHDYLMVKVLPKYFRHLSTA